MIRHFELDEITKRFKANLKNVNTSEEMETLVEHYLIEAFGGIPFYIEVKQGFGQYANKILLRLTAPIKEDNKDDVKINCLGWVQVERTKKFNENFYPHLINHPVFEKLNNYMINGIEHPYIKGTRLFNDTGMGYGYVLFGKNSKAIQKARQEQGSTKNPAPGTIRYEFGIKDEKGNPCPDGMANVIHCSDSCVSAVKELAMTIGSPVTNGAKRVLMALDNRYKSDSEMYEMKWYVNDIAKDIKAKEKELNEKQKAEDEKKENTTKSIEKYVAGVKHNKNNEGK